MAEGETADNEVREAVAGVLAETFPGVPILSEPTSQGIPEPYFRLMEPQVTYKRIMGQRYERLYAFTIQYFPSTDEPVQEAGLVAGKLADALENIPSGGGQLRGTGMRYETVERVLQFFFTVRVQVYKQVQPVPRMAAMIMEGWIK
ncbi:phage tail terminator family protein [Paenibacillus kobensis]|uniref:phage tail terminator family protein n=1 Tax=Paenibacillus kobensis TaxID=59841 RepID=UPI000FD8BCF9|nr:hypothetical protein [Paenibacillus kobensis]